MDTNYLCDRLAGWLGGVFLVMITLTFFCACEPPPGYEQRPAEGGKGGGGATAPAGGSATGTAPTNGGAAARTADQGESSGGGIAGFFEGLKLLWSGEDTSEGDAGSSPEEILRGQIAETRREIKAKRDEHKSIPEQIRRTNEGLRPINLTETAAMKERQRLRLRQTEIQKEISELQMRITRMQAELRRIQSQQQ